MKNIQLNRPSVWDVCSKARVHFSKLSKQINA